MRNGLDLLRTLRAPVLALVAAMLLVACGGGGGGESGGGDVAPSEPRGPAQPTGLDRFLLFPNPQLRADGVYEVAAPEYAVAYYEAVDPTNAKDTVAKWKAANHIGLTTGGHVEHAITIGDQRDLGYGRRMTAHRSPNGDMAFIVENYLVGAYGGYTPLNVEAAVNQVAQWHIGTNAIEFSPGPGGAPDARFAKFYSFDPVTGVRLTTINMDGRGAKAMPTPCVTCHGGRGDPLTPADAAGKRRFPLVMNSHSQQRGDVQAQLHPFEPATFDYADIAGFRRADLEAKIKEINKMVLCAMPLPTGTVPVLPEDMCRRVATPHEYQGTAAHHLKDMYGGDGLPNATSHAVDTYVEDSWKTAGQSDLYLQVQAPSCRVCHLLRGTAAQSDIDFATFAHFDGYKDRIKAHMADRGTMPLSKLIYDKFLSTASMVKTLATYLVADLRGTGFAAGFADGGALPGRAIADPGPGRVVRQGSTTLSAAMSLYANRYQWSLLSGPTGATLSDAATAQPIFTATQDGIYVLQLVATGSSGASAPAQLRIVVDNTLPYDPAALRFADIRATLQDTTPGAGQCTTCHQEGGDGTVLPPIWYTDYDRAGTGNALDATNRHWFYTELRGRINFTDIAASPLLRKPANHHHNGGLRAGYDDTLEPGAAGRRDYDKLLNWVLNGAPE